MTEFEIISRMRDEPQFYESLVSQIGPVIRTQVDFEARLVHFFGERKNCSFDLTTVLESLKKVNVEIEKLKGLVIS